MFASGSDRSLAAVELIEQVRRAPWTSDVRAVALVGSHARGASRSDSDVDLVVLADEPTRYIESTGWISALGGLSVIRTRRWGVLTERRLITENGVELDVGVVTPDWAATDPIDDGTRRVATDGLVALYDPDGLLAALLAAL
jgi:predicted nucleotidyltransferase